MVPIKLVTVVEESETPICITPWRKETMFWRFGTCTKKLTTTRTARYKKTWQLIFSWFSNKKESEYELLRLARTNYSRLFVSYSRETMQLELHHEPFCWSAFPSSPPNSQSPWYSDPCAYCLVHVLFPLVIPFRQMPTSYSDDIRPAGFRAKTLDI